MEQLQHRTAQDSSGLSFSLAVPLPSPAPAPPQSEQNLGSEGQMVPYSLGPWSHFLLLVYSSNFLLVSR
jgi:hypothetical protein